MKSRLRLLLFVLFPLAAFFAGCAEHGMRGIPGAEPAPPEMAQMADEVAQEVETLRGWKFKRPVAKFQVTAEGARVWMEKEIARQCPPGKVERTQAMLRLVGLVPPECDLRKTLLDILQGQVAGFYDTDAKILCLVRRDGDKRLSFVERTMLAHELTHALDDQYIDLTRFTKKHLGQSEDMDLVTSSVFEGSATALMTRYMARQTLSGKLDAAELRDYANDEMGRSQVFMNSPRYFLSLLATYIVGMNFLARGNFPAVLLGGKNVGNELLAAAKDAPRSTEQILHPEKYWDAAARDEPVLVNDDDLEKLFAAPGRFVVHHDTLGELLVALLTQPRDFKPGELALALPTGWTNTAAKGWAGDRFHLLAAGKNSRDAGKTLAEPRGVWITLWDTPQDRDEFLKACADSGVLDGRPHTPLGNLGEVIFFGFTDAQVTEIAGRLEKSPPRMTRDGKAWSPWAS